MLMIYTNGRCINHCHTPNFKLKTSRILTLVIAQDSPTDDILEVDLEYPERLHDEHIDLPFNAW